MKVSGGLLVHRVGAGGSVEVLLVHPGGPLWARRQWASWSIPKGEVDTGAAGHGTGELNVEAVAEREFEEEIGRAAPPGPRVALGEVVQAGGKRVHAWAVAGDLDVTTITSNTFTLEWPPRSGRTTEVPEVDEARWFGLAEAERRILKGQRPFLERLVAYLGAAGR